MSENQVAAIGAILALLANTATLLVLVFRAGKVTQVIEHHGEQIEELKSKAEHLSDKVETLNILAAHLGRRRMDLRIEDLP